MKPKITLLSIWKAIEKAMLIILIPLVIVLSTIVTMWLEIEMSRIRR